MLRRVLQAIPANQRRAPEHALELVSFGKKNELLGESRRVHGASIAKKNTNLLVFLRIPRIPAG
jgi:hypothetical protein